MMNYLSLDQLLIKIRSGSGLGVVIEGVNDGDDEWVYSQWFGHLAHLVTFYPQDGYSKVYDAVEKLNCNQNKQLLVGIIDRDFTTELEIKAQFEPNFKEHVYKTQRYTLENYLLEPEGWFKIAQLFWRNNLPKGYRSIEECDETLAKTFEAFLPAAAYNWMVWDISRQYNPKTHLEYKDWPNLDPEKLYMNLLIYCRNEELPDPDEYPLRLELLKNKRKLWHQKVSGKMVFQYLTETFPVPRQRPNRHLFVNYYVSSTDAPNELIRLVNFLIKRYLGEDLFAKSAV